VGATFNGELHGGNGKRASLKVPGIKDALIAADGTVPITGDVATLLALYDNGSECMLSDEEQIATWLAGKLDAK